MRLPTLRRRPAAEQPTGNPATLAADLHTSQATEAALAKQLLNLRELLEESDAARRVGQLERQLTEAWAAHKSVADQLRGEHRVSVALRKDRDGLRSQLDNALGRPAEQFTAIEGGTAKGTTL